MNELLVKAEIRMMKAKERFIEIMTENSGEGFIDTALKILISVVIGALLLAGLYTIFKDTLLPTLTDRIQKLFDFKG